MTKNNKTIVIIKGTEACSRCRHCDKSYENLRPSSLALKLLALHYKKCHPTLPLKTNVGRKLIEYKYQN